MASLASTKARPSLSIVSSILSIPSILQRRMTRWGGLIGGVTISLWLSGCQGKPPASDSPPPDDRFKVGLILVGSTSDGGWSQAHYEGVDYIARRVPEMTFIYEEKVNPSDRPDITPVQAAENLIAQGAKLIIFNSNDYKDDALTIAQNHPELGIVHATGDYAWKEGRNYKNQPNLTNVMVKMIYGRMISGCAAALMSQTGKIGFVGSLINDETRSLVSATYLGARYCWQNYRQKDGADLTFKVSWIGFWFHIPGKTVDPSQVAQTFYNTGFDVVLSGIDTPEVPTVARSVAETGKKVYFLHYTLPRGCSFAPELCLGVPTYNWGSLYLRLAQAQKDGQFKGEFIWADPFWQDINDRDQSPVGFVRGQSLSPEANGFLDQFIAALGSGKLNLYQPGLTFQDGSAFIPPGTVATPQQIWYMPQLLSGIEGASK